MISNSNRDEEHPNPLHACRSPPPPPLNPWNSPSLMGVCSSTYKDKLHSDNLFVFLHKCYIAKNIDFTPLHVLPYDSPYFIYLMHM